MSGPIKPKEVKGKLIARIPDKVYNVFNDLIVENWDGNSANFTQDEAVKRIAKIMLVSHDTAFKRGYLDVEDAYRKVGWTVEYDKPGYNENYEANFTFSK